MSRINVLDITTVPKRVVDGVPDFVLLRREKNRITNPCGTDKTWYLYLMHGYDWLPHYIGLSKPAYERFDAIRSTRTQASITLRGDHYGMMSARPTPVPPVYMPDAISRAVQGVVYAEGSWTGTPSELVTLSGLDPRPPPQRIPGLLRDAAAALEVVGIRMRRSRLRVYFSRVGAGDPAYEAHLDALLRQRGRLPYGWDGTPAELLHGCAVSHIGLWHRLSAIAPRYLDAGIQINRYRVTYPSPRTGIGVIERINISPSGFSPEGICGIRFDPGYCDYNLDRKRRVIDSEAHVEEACT